jgi:Ricin-type beta-trefoil lectin domain
MLSRNLLVSGASVVALALSALGVTAIPISASADAAAAGRQVSRTADNGLLNLGSGYCLGISHGLRYGPAIQAGCVDHPDQRWNIGIPDSMGYYRLYNGFGSCLGVSAGETRNGAQVVATKCLNGHSDQYWQEQGRCAPHFFVIRNQKSGKLAGVSKGSTQKYAAIVIWRDQHQCTNQVWEQATLG